MFTQKLVFDIIIVVLSFEIPPGLYAITWKYILYYVN